MECPDKSTTRGTPAGPLSPCQGATCYVLRAEHAPQMSLAQKGQQICLSVYPSVCSVVVQLLWNASNSYGLVSKFNYVKYFTCQCSCPATSVRPSLRPSVRSARRLSRCLVVPFATGQVAAAVAKRSWPRSCSRCHCHCHKRSQSRCHCHCPRPLHRLLKRNAIQSV